MRRRGKIGEFRKSFSVDSRENSSRDGSEDRTVEARIEGERLQVTACVDSVRGTEEDFKGRERATKGAG